MKKSKIFFGGAVLGLVSAAVYSYVKNYVELAREKKEAPQEDGTIEETSEFEAEATETAEEAEIICDGDTGKTGGIDLEVAKAAAEKTIQNITEGAKKLWGVTKDSAKAVSGVVMENYGDSINGAKDKVAAAAETVKSKAVEVKDAAVTKYSEIKKQVLPEEEAPEEEEIAETAEEAVEETAAEAVPVKEKIEKAFETAQETLREKKDQLTGKIENFKQENPEKIEKIEKVKEDAKSALNAAAEAITGIFDNVSKKVADLKKDICDAEEVTPVEEAEALAEEAPDEEIFEAEAPLEEAPSEEEPVDFIRQAAEAAPQLVKEVSEPAEPVEKKAETAEKSTDFNDIQSKAQEFIQNL